MASYAPDTDAFAQAGDEARPLYFLHIPKTAGTTLNGMLDALYNPFEACGPLAWSHLLRLPRESLGAYRLFRGHLYGYLHRYLGTPLRTFTYLRDPVERAISHYRHLVRHKDHYMHERTVALGGFGRFIRDPAMARLVADFQVRAIAFEFDPPAVFATLTPEARDTFEIDWIRHTMPDPVPVEQRLDTARQRLEQMCFVGVAERFDESLPLLCNTFGWPCPPTPKRLNIDEDADQAEPIDPADRDYLRDHNRADYELYAFAASLLERRLRAFVPPVPGPPGLRLFQAQAGLRKLESEYRRQGAAHQALLEEAGARCRALEAECERLRAELAGFRKAIDGLAGRAGKG